LDIDNTVLLAGTMLLCHEALRLRRKIGKAGALMRSLPLALVIGISLSAKLVTPVLCISALICCAILLGDRRYAGVLTISAFLGIMSFCAIWLVYARLFQVPIDFPFVFTFAGRIGKLGFGRGHVSLWSAIPRFALWVTPTLAVVATWGAGVACRQSFIRRATGLCILPGIHAYVW
jgi:hypothetical protein